MRSIHKFVRTLAVAGALGLALAACSSSQGGAQEEEQQAAGTGNVADTPRYTIAMITHGAPGDTFWDLIRDGALAAAAKDNVEFEYSNNRQAPEQATLVQNAIDRRVDAIAVTLSNPAAMSGAVQKAVDAGIPVVAFNSGLDAWQDAGALMYFGQDETLAGRAAGERLSEAGAKHVLCVIQEQGQVQLEARCAGVQEGFSGTTEILYVQGTQMPQVRSTIANKLRTTPAIDRVLTLGGPFAMTALQSVQDAGSAAEVVTFDLNAEVVGAIEEGEILWAVDQQPYVQGYLAIDGLWLYLNRGHTIGGGEPVLTGPAFVDSTNIDTVAEQY
jgi:simple sugar transport system substrate-binding protein